MIYALALIGLAGISCWLFELFRLSGDVSSYTKEDDHG